MPLRARDVMTPDVVSGSPDTRLTQIVDEIVEKRFSGIPILDDGELVGLVEVGDLLPHPSHVPASQVDVLEFQGEWLEENDLEEFSEGLGDLVAEQVMRTELPTIEPDMRIGEMLSRLIQAEFRRLLVVDEDENLIGVVTRKDLLDVFYRWP